jgi:hypothetical protein
MMDNDVLVGVVRLRQGRVCLRAASIASRRSSSRHGLCRKATAPSSSARASARSSACDVMKTIGTRHTS